MPTSSRRPRLLAVVALAATLAAFPLGTLASHDFADVADSNPFHTDISALAASGVTTGCGGGNYCPSAFVTREQMAAFMNRLGALQAGKTPVVNAAELDGLTSGQFLRSDVQTSGVFNCMGSAMQPAQDEDYTYGGNARSLATGNGYFNCGVLVPNGATVTQFRAGIYDGVTDGYVQCELYRFPLFLRDGGPDQMASVQSGFAEALGDLVLPDLSIDFADIDNDTYSYKAECFISSASSDLTLNGVSVTYSFEGWPVP